MAVRARFGVFAFALALLVLAHSLPIRLLAQDSTTAAIIGTVTDSTKALMPGVSITLTGPALMGARTIVTDTDGSYRIPNLPPGPDYKLVFELAGFSTVTREGILLRIGFTASVNTEMQLGSMTENVTVSGASPVVDVTSTRVTTEHTAAQLTNVLGSRDYTALMSAVPGVMLNRMDVGGSNAITSIGFTAYGISDSRGEVEGINTNLGAGGNSDMLYVNMNSFEEFSVTPVGAGAESPKPGNLSSVVSKSGGNSYHGSVYYDYENSSMEAFNIDDEQIRLGVSGYGKVATREVNRLESTYDVNADLGGFIKRDRLWWFASVRRQDQRQNFPNLVDETAHVWLPITSFKLTYQLSPNNKLTGFYMRGTKYHDMYNITSTPIINAAGLTNEVYPTGNYSTSWNSVLGQKMVLVLRTGAWYDRSYYIGKCDEVPDGRGGVGYGAECQTQYLDTPANMQQGTSVTTLRQIDRPQINGSLSYFQNGWLGSHDFKIGGEFMKEMRWQSDPVYNNMILILNNGAPSQVRIYLPPNKSELRLTTLSGYVQDSWRLNSRLTINPGLRIDRYRSWLPEQAGATGHVFPELTGYTFNNLGPRLGMVYSITSDQKTVLKANYGRYWSNPGTDGAALYNANASSNYSTYEWVDANPVYAPAPPPTADPRGLPIFDPSKVGRLVSTTGTRPDFSSATSVGPGYRNPFTNQFALYLDHELASSFGLRTGYVWNGTRQNRAIVNANQPFDAFTVPVTVINPGPDGRAGTADDGGPMQAFDLDPARLGLPPSQIITNADALDGDHHTWEITANRRQTGWWSLLGTFTKTWSREAVVVPANGTFSPNQLINTTDGRNQTTRWNAKISTTVQVPLGIRLISLWRHQSGANFAPTFTTRLNYGTVAIQAKPSQTERRPTMNIVDLRVEKDFGWSLGILGRSKVSVFGDLYNMFNTNAAQELTIAYGASFLRPTNITGPRIARLGVRFTF